MKTVLLVSYPEGAVSVDNFSISEIPKPTLTKPKTFLIKVLYMSVDPYMRGRMNPNRKSYVPPFPVGKSISGFLVGEVVESNSEAYPVSSFVSASAEFSEYVILEEGAGMLSKLSIDRSELSHGLGVLGMPGVTAYFGLLDFCSPKPGETLVVSGAAGAVGSYVAQIGKAKGCKVIGIAGSDDKKRVLTEELGCDAAINYNTENVKEKIQTYAPAGVDMYFDNVGGEITDAVIANMNIGGRISVCGSISAYEKSEDIGPRPWGTILGRGLIVRGFIVSREFGARWNEGVQGLTELFRSNKLKAKETFNEGIESVPQAFVNLFKGSNTGKQVIRLSA